MSLLRIDNLCISFSGRRVVSDVAFTVRPGQTLAIVGESGSGKSVTAMSLLRLLPRETATIESGRALFSTTAGEIDLYAIPDRDLRTVRGGQIAMIFQEPMTSLNPVFTIGEQIIETIRLHQHASARDARQLAADALAQVEITDPARRLRQYPHEFSGGMRQRVMIAMALACRPRLLIADEPTTALDVTIQAQILALLDRLRAPQPGGGGGRGMSMIFITHALPLVAQRADHVAVMAHGRIVESAPAADLFSNPLHPYTRALLACIPSLAHRRDRLATVAQTLDDPAQFRPIPLASSPASPPWWPTQSPAGPTARYQLAESRANHHVGIWSL